MGKIIWFTGLSGSGKTTIAKALARRLRTAGGKVKILDGDAVRKIKHKHLGFSRKDIRENNRLIAEMAKTAGKTFDFVLVPIISPYSSDRTMVRKLIGDDFIELYINTPLKDCIKRDVKGLYKKVLAGEIKNFIGISSNSPYQPPKSPNLEINTMNYSLKESVKIISDYLHKNFYENKKIK